MGRLSLRSSQIGNIRSAPGDHLSSSSHLRSSSGSYHLPMTVLAMATQSQLLAPVQLFLLKRHRGNNHHLLMMICGATWALMPPSADLHQSSCSFFRTPGTQHAAETRAWRIEGEMVSPGGGGAVLASFFTPTLGVMFFKPRTYRLALFEHDPLSEKDSTSDFPLFAFIVEGIFGSARCRTATYC
jgi:hypothetical protein